MDIDKMMDKILIFLLKLIGILICLMVILWFCSVFFKALFGSIDFIN